MMGLTSDHAVRLWDAACTCKGLCEMSASLSSTVLVRGLGKARLPCSKKVPAVWVP